MSLTEQILALNAAPPVRVRAVRPEDYTTKIDVGIDRAEVAIKTGLDDPESINGQAWDVLKEHGLDPAEWEVKGFMSGKWTMASGAEGISAKFSFARKPFTPDAAEPLDIDELVKIIAADERPVLTRSQGDHCYIVALGDMQFGKVDGDGVEGTLRRSFEYITKAAEALVFYRKRFRVGHIHIAWLGDHIEGFVSQGGANVARTGLTLTEQTRLTRRVMLHALTTFAPLAERVTMVAVPGNHGEPQRFMGKGITRYDDSHDTEALVAVQEAAQMDPARYGHVEFYVPEHDEMTVTLDLAGTTAAHAHGHQFRPGQHFKWWGEQAFGDSPLAVASLLLLGHLHHELIESNGKRLVIQVPALESESTWYRHAKGVGGNHGIIVAITKDGKTGPIEVIR